MNKMDQAILAIAQDEPTEEQIGNAAARVRSAMFLQAASGPQRIRGCADYQALIPAYLNRTLSAGRALLFQDHTRECINCRHALAAARESNGPTLVRPITPPTSVVPRVWAIAAVGLLAAGITAFVATQFWAHTASGQIAVQTVSGTLYAVSDRASTPIFSGREIKTGERVRTAKGSTAVIRLGDGSQVEMNERAELAVISERGGSKVRLDRGNIIIQAAKQRTGTLDVLTPDCTVSVKGTIFAVDRGVKGTRVSVVEGSVKVAQGAQAQMLKPGDQVTTDASLVKTSVKEDVSWSRDSARYMALLGEFNAIKKGIEEFPSQGLRHQSKLLSYASRDTVLYASIPNVGATLGEAQRLFNDRLQQSDVLREWWAQQQEGPKVQELVNSLRTFSNYLGNEIVLTIDSNGDGEYSRPMVLAEVKLPGLEGFLGNEFRRLAGPQAGGLPEIVHLDVASDEQRNSEYYRNKRRNGSAKEGPMLIGLTNNLMVVSWDRNQMQEVARRAAEEAEPQDSPLIRDAQSAYQKGAGWLMCVNMEHITRNSVGKGRRRSPDAKIQTGLENMQNLIVERREVAGRTENQAVLTFPHWRSGIANWLAEPSPMGSLDFVSPNATFVVSMALRSPNSMLDDVFKMISQDDPNFEQGRSSFRNKTGIDLTPSLAKPLGGEFTFAFDGPMLPLPSWKFAIEVNQPDQLQATIEQFVAAANNNNDTDCQDCKLTLTKEDANGRTYYALTTSKLNYEIDYVYTDGYLLAAPNRTLLNTAIQNREMGYVLTRSDTFRSQLPRDGGMNFSALVYHNLGSALKTLADQVANADGVTADKQAAIRSIAAGAAPSLIYAYGMPDRIVIATTGNFFGLDLNALALPNLLKMANPIMHGGTALAAPPHRTRKQLVN
jgi:hypothetical protein